MMMDYQTTDFLKDAIGFVEANDFEIHSLWLHNEELKEYPDPWIENHSGRFVEIGQFGGKPICLSLISAIVRNQKVIFYHPTSLVVHWDMIYSWLVKVAPASARKGGILNKTDAGNFVNIFRSIR